MTSLLERVLPPGRSRPNVIGDLHEEYGDLRRRGGRIRADVWYVFAALSLVLSYLRPVRSSLPSRVGDLRHAFRSLWRRPGFTLSAVVTIALGVGAGTAMYSIVDNVLLRPLPFPEPDRLVRVWGSNTTLGELHLDLEYGDIVPFRTEVSGFVDAAGFSVRSASLIEGDQPAETVQVGRVTASFLETLGVHPLIGGDLPEDRAGSALISEGLWRRRFGADPEVIGRTLALETSPYTVVGVLPDRVAYPAGTDVWRALTPEEMEDDDREVHFVARMAEGATLSQVTAEVGAVAERLAEANPESHAGHSAWVQPLHAMMVRDVNTALLTLLGAVGALLFIACANVAALLMSRSMERSGDIALRMALGASRARVITLHLTESLILAVLGGALGIAVGRFALTGILAIAPPLPRETDIVLDLRVMAIMMGVAVLSGIAFGLLPAARATRGNEAGSLRVGAPESSPAPSRSRGQRTLVSAELALSCLLVVLGMLFFRTFREATSFDRGFEPGNLLIMNVEPLHEPEGDEAVALFERIDAAVRSLPEVAEVGFSSHIPVEQRGFRVDVVVPDDASTIDDVAQSATVRIVTPGFIPAISLPVMAGRGWTEETRGTPSLLVNERFVETRLGPGVDPVGVELELPWIRGPIVGVVGDVHPGPDEPAEPIVYVPFDQLAIPGLWLAARTTVDPESVIPIVREQIHRIEPSAPLDQAFSAESALAASTVSERFVMVLGVTFALIALGLAAVGVYGVTSVSVQARRAEIGIRRALGASRQQVAREVGGQVMRMTALGTLAGVAGAIAAERWVRSILASASTTDPSVLVTVVVVLAGVSSLAAALPIRRATKVDPTLALRRE